VPAAANGDHEILLACEEDRDNDVVDRCASRDQRRPAIDDRVPYAARLVVVGGVGTHDLALESVSEL
jgi:hypothetical protein